MNRFSRFITNKRIAVLLCIGLLTVFLGYQAAFIPRDNDPFSLFPAEDPDVIHFKRTGDTYGIYSVNVVALEAEDIFTHEALSVLRELTRAIEALDGVKHVLSLANLPDTKRVGDTLVAKPLLDPETVPADPEVLAALRRYVLSNPLLVGGLVSADGRAALITIMFEKDAGRKELVRQIKAVAAERARGHRIYFTGMDMAMEFMASLIAKDLGLLIPVMMAVFLLMLYLGLGLRGLVLSLGTVLLSLVWAMGGMSAAGMTMTMVSSAVPMVIMVMAILYSVFLMVRYVQFGGKGIGPEIAARVFEGAAVPVIVSGAALFLGFLSMRAASLSVVRDFGTAAAIGVFCATVLSMSFIPAMLACLRFKSPRKWVLSAPSGVLSQHYLSGLGSFVTGKRTIILILSLAALVLAATEIPHVSRDADMMAAFPEESEPMAANRLLQRGFGGSQLITINFSAEDIRHPAILEQMALLEKELRVLPHVFFPQSAVGVVTMLNRLINDRPGLPDSMPGVTNLWFLLEGQSSIGMMVASDFKEAIVQARIGESDPAVVRRVLEQIRQVVDRTVKTDLVFVSMADQPEHLRKLFQKALAEQIARKVAVDLKFHTGRDFAAKDELAEALLPVLSHVPELDAREREKLFERLKAYFLSEESDIVLDEDYDVSGVAGKLARLDDFSEAAVLNTLKETLPSSLWAEDPEALGYAAVSICAIMESCIANLRHRPGVAYAMEMAGVRGGTGDASSLSENAGLGADAASDLWALNHGSFGLDVEAYRQLTGEEPREQDRVRFKVMLGGWPLVNGKFSRMLSAATVGAILLALGVIFVLLCGQMRSPVRALQAMIPAGFTLVLTFAAMGLLGIAIDYTTVMILCVAVTVCVVFAVHLLSGFQGAPSGDDHPGQALEAALKTEGTGILVSSLVIAPGFFTLFFSVMPPQRHLGLLIFLSTVFAAIGTLVVLPALMAKTR